MNTEVWVIPASIAILASVIAGVTDALRFKVYNKLTFPLAAGGLAYHSLSGGRDGFFLAAAGLAVGLAVLLVPYQLGALGAGDVKFFAAVSAWLGLAPMFTILTSACIATGLYSLVVLLRRDGARGVGRNLYLSFAELATIGVRTTAKPSVQQVLATAPDCRQRLVPFSAMIGVGVLAAVARQALALH
jgi:prepilin peptidase CpaA